MYLPAFRSFLHPLNGAETEPTRKPPPCAPHIVLSRALSCTRQNLSWLVFKAPHFLRDIRKLTEILQGLESRAPTFQEQGGCLPEERLWSGSYQPPSAKPRITYICGGACPCWCDSDRTGQAHAYSPGAGGLGISSGQKAGSQQW